MVEFLLTKIIDLFYYTSKWCCCKDERTSEFRTPYNTHVHVINFFVFSMQLFIIIPFFPYIVALAPIFLAINFKIEQYKLTKLSHKPQITQFLNVLFTF